MSKTKNRIMLMVAAGIFVLVGAWNVSPVLAETAKTTKNTRVMQRPGEKSRVVMRVPAGKPVKILGRDGRWVKIRVNGRTGWVTRTSLSGTASARTTASTARRKPFVEGRSKRRGWSGSGPRDRVGADAVDGAEGEDAAADDEEPAEESRAHSKRASAREEDERADDAIMVAVADARLRAKPSARGKPVASLDRGDELTVLGKSRSGAWIRVEDTDGRRGWIRSSDVAAADSVGFQYPKKLIRAGARAGYMALSTVFRSDGPPANDLANYDITSAALSLSVGGELFYRYRPQYMFGGDLAYTGTRASPGIRYQRGDQAVDIGFTHHEIRGGALAGYNFQDRRGIVMFARVGYYYGVFGIHDVGDPAKNLASLPSEILQGLTLGTHLEVPRLTSSIGLRASFDALYPASLTQTGNLEDGELDSVFAAWGAAQLTYRWKSSIDIEAGYRYAYAKSIWTGPAARPTGAVMQSARKDVTHLISVGLGKRF